MTDIDRISRFDSFKARSVPAVESEEVVEAKRLRAEQFEANKVTIARQLEAALRHIREQSNQPS